jgi:hypothetical protein
MATTNNYPYSVDAHIYYSWTPEQRQQYDRWVCSYPVYPYPYEGSSVAAAQAKPWQEAMKWSMFPTPPQPNRKKLLLLEP